MTARHASVNEAELFFERFGKGVPILVMHGGLGLDHTYFRSWLDKLGEHAELIFYDHRGNGRSTRAVSLAGVDHATFAADADQLRAHLGLDRIIVLGHSYGGFLAQEYASRYGSEGGHLAGLILCSTAPALDSMPVTQANMIARLHEIKVPTLVISGADDWITPPSKDNVSKPRSPTRNLRSLNRSAIFHSSKRLTNLSIR